MPMSTRAGGYGDSRHFEHILEHLFTPALERAGFCVVPPSVASSEVIHAEIIKNLEESELVLGDLSAANPNVFFELGIRVALDRPLALVRDERSVEVPFDTASINFHTYLSDLGPWNLESQIERLALFLRLAGEQQRNALWRHFGNTRRAQPRGDPEIANLVAAAAAIAREVAAELRLVSVDHNELVLSSDDTFVDEQRVRRIVALGAEHGYAIVVRP